MMNMTDINIDNLNKEKSVIIEAKNISKVFSNNTEVLKDFSYSFCEGRFYAIMGRSGAGKSTLLNIIGAIDRPTSGEVLLEGKNVAILNETVKSKIRMKKIGFVFQGFYLNPYLNAIENVMVPMRINPDIDKKERKSLAIKLLKQFGAEVLEQSKPSQMSGGEQQRVCIARALANNPQIILADEPTGNLDEENEKTVFEHLRGLAQEGHTVIVVSHNERVKEYADEVILIER